MTFEEWWATKCKNDSFYAQWGESLIVHKAMAREAWNDAQRPENLKQTAD